MKVGVISDIHGNLVALNAVLRDLDKQHVDQVVCLGDLAFKGPSPDECVRSIKRLGIPCVFGNTDLYVLSATDAPKADIGIPYEPSQAELPYLRWHVSRMSSSEIEYLSGLPFDYRMEADGQTMLFVHATPRDCFSAIEPTDSGDKLDSTLGDVNADWIFMGHIHRPFAFKHKGVNLVNVGAIGFSLDHEWRASYCIVDTATRSIGLHRVEYNITECVRIATDVGFCFSPEWYGEALRRGWWEPIPYEKRRDIDKFPS